MHSCSIEYTVTQKRKRGCYIERKPKNKSRGGLGTRLSTLYIWCWTHSLLSTTIIATDKPTNYCLRRSRGRDTRPTLLDPPQPSSFSFLNRLSLCNDLITTTSSELGFGSCSGFTRKWWAIFICCSFSHLLLAEGSMGGFEVTWFWAESLRLASVDGLRHPFWSFCAQVSPFSDTHTSGMLGGLVVTLIEYCAGRWPSWLWILSVWRGRKEEGKVDDGVQPSCLGLISLPFVLPWETGKVELGVTAEIPELVLPYFVILLWGNWLDLVMGVKASLFSWSLHLAFGAEGVAARPTNKGTCLSPSSADSSPSGLISVALSGGPKFNLRREFLLIISARFEIQILCQTAHA